MAAQDVLVDGARGCLEPGEELLAACLANPRGWGQMALTSRRLITFKVEMNKLGKVAGVGELLGAVDRDRVEAITVKRFGLGRKITIKIDGREAPLEGDGGAPALAEAFADAFAAGPTAAAA